MNAKEFLIEKCNGKPPEDMQKDFETFPPLWVESMLDEYARFKAIEFGEWIGKKQKQDSWFTYNGSTWFVHMEGHKTTEELYQIFQEETQ